MSTGCNYTIHKSFCKGSFLFSQKGMKYIKMLHTVSGVQPKALVCCIHYLDHEGSAELEAFLKIL